MFCVRQGKKTRRGRNLASAEMIWSVGETKRNTSNEKKDKNFNASRYKDSEEEFRKLIHGSICQLKSTGAFRREFKEDSTGWSFRFLNILRKQQGDRMKTQEKIVLRNQERF